MGGSTFGTAFSVTTFGESHGLALGAIVEGCPAGMMLCEKDIQPYLDKRKPGQSAVVTPRKEGDKVVILSGIFEGLTTGTPIALIVHNENARSSDYDHLKDVIRPGHADIGYLTKYGVRDYRGGGRASARETVSRVAAGAIALKYLQDEFNTTVRACVDQIGPIKADPTAMNWQEVHNNAFFFPVKAQLPQLKELLESLRKEGDSVGAGVRLECHNVPAGIGEPVFEKLDAALAGAMVSINAVKAVEIGAGFSAIEQRGSSARDTVTSLTQIKGDTNNAGGILGGIATGLPIDMRIALKPTSSVRAKIDTIDTLGQPVELSVRGRHDPCVGIRAVPIVEAMAGLVLMDHVLRQRGQNPHWPKTD